MTWRADRRNVMGKNQGEDFVAEPSHSWYNRQEEQRGRQ